MPDYALKKLPARELRALYRSGGELAARVYWIALARGINL